MLQQKLDSLPTDTLVLMVTHQVVISAITNISPASGGFVVYNTETNTGESCASAKLICRNLHQFEIILL